MCEEESKKNLSVGAQMPDPIGENDFSTATDDEQKNLKYLMDELSVIVSTTEYFFGPSICLALDSASEKQLADKVFEDIHAYIDETGLEIRRLDNTKRVIEVASFIAATIMEIEILVDEEKRTISLSARYPMYVADEYLVLIRLFFAKLNENLTHGAFCIRENRSIVYRNSFYYSETGFSIGVFEQCLKSTMLLSDRHYEEIKRIARGKLENYEKRKLLSELRTLTLAI